MEDLKLLLIGNPNAGKSTLFNALTGGHVKVGNWHGVTVGVVERSVRFCGRRVTVCDLPGIYSLCSLSMEEKLTRDYLASHRGDTVVFVSECAALERSLYLFCELLKRGHKGLLVLTKRRAFERAGGRLDIAELQARLKVPVLVVEGKGRRRLREEVFSSVPASPAFLPPPEEVMVGIFTPVKEGLTRADRFLLNGFISIPVFLLLLVATFYLTFAPGCIGDFLKGRVEAFFTETLAGAASGIASPILKSFICNGLLKGLGGVLCVLPQIAILYLVLIVLEESGFLSRLAYLTDGFFSKLGLNGRATFSLLMGFGCTAAAILTTRGLDDKKIQRRVILALPYIPCSAKLPVFLALSASLFPNPFYGVLLLYGMGVGLSVLIAFLLKEKKNAPFVMELAPLQIPRPLFVIKSLLFQLKQFIIKVATVVLAFFIFSWLLSSFSFSFTLCAVEESMLASLCGFLKFLFAPIGMPDWKIAYAALSGLVAKENVAGTLSMFYGSFPYSPPSALAFSAFLLTCSPCVSSIAATAKETGVGRALLYAVMQTLSSLLFSYVIYFAASGGIVYLAIFLTPALAIAILGKNLERIHRNRGGKPQKLHGRRLRPRVLLLAKTFKGKGHPRQRAEGKLRLSRKSG